MILHFLSLKFKFAYAIITFRDFSKTDINKKETDQIQKQQNFAEVIFSFAYCKPAITTPTFLWKKCQGELVITRVGFYCDPSDPSDPIIPPPSRDLLISLLPHSKLRWLSPPFLKNHQLFLRTKTIRYQQNTLTIHQNKRQEYSMSYLQSICFQIFDFPGHVMSTCRRLFTWGCVLLGPQFHIKHFTSSSKHTVSLTTSKTFT